MAFDTDKREIDPSDWWHVDRLPSYKVSQLYAGLPVGSLGADEYESGIYVLEQNGEPVYVRATGDLRERIASDFLLAGKRPHKSDLYRRVAEHLGIASRGGIKRREYELTDEDVARVEEWLAKSELKVLPGWPLGVNEDWFAQDLLASREVLLQPKRFKSRSAYQAEQEVIAAAAKRRDQLLIVAGAFAAIITAIVCTWFLPPYRMTEAQPHANLLYPGRFVAFVLWLLLAGGAALVIKNTAGAREHWSFALRLILLAVLLPMVALGSWVIVFHPRHDLAEASFQTYSRYFHRVPDEKLGTPFIAEFNPYERRMITICADLGRQDGSDFLCALLDMRNPVGHEVTGGFQAHEIESVPDGEGGTSGFPEYVSAHDCWGDADVCDES